MINLKQKLEKNLRVTSVCDPNVNLPFVFYVICT
jgi:hypothetical protein